MRNSFRLFALAALGLPVPAMCPLLAQNTPAQNQSPQATQAKPATPAPDMNNPTRPEVQPSLAEDRDPVPSPDIVVPEKENAANTPGGKGQLKDQGHNTYKLDVDVDEVLLNCTVVDEKGRPVLDLKQGDFRVWEDGVPQTTSSFNHQDQPVSMGILIDSSGSMLDKREAVDAAANKLLAESNPKSTAFVVNFNEKAYLDQGFTLDRVALRRGIDHFDARGPTALYDAVAASANELSHHAKQPKQALLIVTDGADNASRLGLEEAIRRVQNLGGPVVYTIGLLYDADRKEADKARNDLEMLSSETGGVAYFPKSLDQVDEIASEVAADIRNQYIVGYHSTKAASLGGYRTVHVEASAPGHKHLIVRTRRGYYAKAGQRANMAAAKPSSAAPPGTQP